MEETHAQAAAAALEEKKARLRDAFAAWLDEVMADEVLPPGVGQDLLAELETGAAVGSAPEGDLYAVWSSLTALTQEVRLGGRAFREMQDVLQPLVEHHTQTLAAHEGALDAARDMARQAFAARTERELEAQRAARGDSLDALLDMRDRLVRATEHARPLLVEAGHALRAPRLFGLQRAHPATERTLEAVRALEEGCRLSLARLDDALSRMGVAEIDCLGKPFDPERMTAVEVANGGGAGGAIVQEVHRTGYECAGRLVRAAQVKVGRTA